MCAKMKAASEDQATMRSQIVLSCFVFILSVGAANGITAVPNQTKEPAEPPGRAAQATADPIHPGLDPKKLKLDWKFKPRADWQIQGEMESAASPILSGGKIFAGRIVGTFPRRYARMQFQGYVYCLDAAAGKDIWQTEVEGKDLLRLSAEQADGRLYVLTHERLGKTYKLRLYCLDQNTGHAVWKIDEEREGFAYGISTPIISDKTVCVEIRSDHNKQELYGYDKTSGKELWTYEKGSKDEDDTTILYKNRLYTTDRDDRKSFVRCLDVDTGRLKWMYEIPEYLEFGRCVASDGKIFIVTRDFRDKRNVSFVRGLDSATGTLVWRAEVGVPFVRSLPTAAGGQLFIAGYNQLPPKGAIYSFDIANGERQWTFEMNENAVPTSSPAVLGDEVCVSAESGSATAQSLTGYGYCLNKRSGNLIWRSSTKGANIDSQPAASGSYLFWCETVGQGRIGYIYCYDRNSGERIRRLRTGRPIASGPLVHEGSLIAAAWEGHIYAFAEGDVVTGRMAVVFVFAGILFQLFFGLFQGKIHESLERKGRRPALRREQRYRMRAARLERMFDKANRIARSLSGGSGLLIINVYLGWVLMFLVFLMPVSIAYQLLVIIPLDPWLPRWWPFAAYGLDAAIIAAIVFLV
jgi:outer membrane protein assembly factor BamB